MPIVQFFFPFVYFFANIVTAVITFLIRRNKSIVLFGSWGGHRFAGNSRYLFQYLSQEREKWGFRKVIFVTREKDIYNELQQMGYEAYMMHSLKSLFYHFKAGVHIINTSPTFSYAYNNGLASGDIMGVFSLGARKINLGHTIGDTKAPIERMHSQKYTGIWNAILRLYIWLLNSTFFSFFVTAGGWGNAIDVEMCVSGNSDEKTRKNRIFTGAPIYCTCLKYTKSEKKIIDDINKHKIKILYTPTYRSASKNIYENPLNNESFCKFLGQHGILWIEKMHQGAKEEMDANEYPKKCAYKLEKSFDINLIIREMDILVTDYSNSYVKGFYYNKPNLFYTPDYDYYCKYDNGLVSEFEKYIRNKRCDRVEELMSNIIHLFENHFLIEDEDEYRKKYDELFRKAKNDYETICEDIFGKAAKVSKI